MTLINEYLEKIQDPMNEQLLSIGTVLTAYSLASMAITVYKNHISKNGRRCNSYEGGEKAVCITQVKLEAIDKKIRVLKTNMNKCGNNSCRVTTQKRILKAEEEMDSLKDRLKIYQNKAEADAEEKKAAEESQGA